MQHYFEARPALIRYSLVTVAVLLVAALIISESTIRESKLLLIFFFGVIASAFSLYKKPAFLVMVVAVILVNGLIFSSAEIVDVKSLWIIEIDFLLMSVLLIAISQFNRKIYDELSKKEQDLAQAQLLGEIGSWRLTLSTNQLEWSEQNYRNFGIAPGTPLTYETFLACVHPDDRDYVNRHWQSAVLHNAQYDIDHRVIVDGKVKWLRERVQLEFNKDGKLLGGFGTTQDISDRKTSELELQESRQRYEGIIQTAMDAIIIIDENGLIQLFNTSAETLFGYPAADVMGSSVDRFIPEHLRKRHQSYVQDFIRNGTSHRKMGLLPVLTGLKANGEEFPFEATLSLSNVGDKKSFTIVLRDLTERLKIEELHQERLQLQDKLLKVASSVPGIIATFKKLPDGSAMMPYASPAIETIYGITAESVATDASPIMERVHPDDLPNLIDSINISAKTLAPWHQVYRFLNPNTGERWIEGNSLPIKEKDGSILWHGYVQDVTERKQSEAVIAWNERQLSLIMNAVPALIAYVDPDYRYLRINKTYQDWFCLHPDQILGHNIQDIIGEKAWSIVEPYLERAKAGERVSFDYEIPYGTGKPRWVHASYIPDRDVNYQIKGIVIHVVDIQERVNSKLQIEMLNLQLQHRLEEMDKIFDTVPVGLAITYDLEGANHISGNKTMEKMLGLPPGSELSKNNESAPNYGVSAGGQALSIYELPMQQASRGHTVSEQMLEIVRADGKIINVLANALPLRNKDGTIRGAIGAFLDISALVKTEESLQKSQHQLRLLVEQAPVSIAMFDTNMNYLVTSRLWKNNFGRGFEKIIGLNHYDHIPDLPEKWKTVHRQVLAGEYLSQNNDLWLQADGSRSWIHWAAHPWSNEHGEIGGIIIAADDVTDQHLAQEALLASEHFTRDVLNSMPAMVAVLDNHGKIYAVNKPWRQSAQEAVSFPAGADNLSEGADYLAVCGNSVAQGDPYAEQALAGLNSLLSGQRENFVMEYPCYFPDSEKWFLMQAQKMAINNPYLIVAHTDITELKLAQEALRQSQTQLGLIVSEINAGYWDFNLKSSILYVSAEWRRQLGIDEQEKLDSLALWEARVHPDDRAYFNENTTKFLDGQQIIYELEYRMMHNKGDYRCIHSRGVLLRDTENRPYRLLGMNLDITEYKNANKLKEHREQMEHSFRYYVASQTAAAIAHELNQPLTAISYYSDAAQAMLGSDKVDHEALKLILEKCEKQAIRAGDVMRQLLALLHKGEASSESINLNAAIRDIQSMVKPNSKGQHYELIFELDEELPPISGSFLLVQKILLNLVTNSMEAMHSSGLENGSIIITSKHYAAAPEMAEVIVHDSGIGVADTSALKKMFEPFVTTKKDGLGVGLAICRALIEAHNGDMWAEQNIGTGLSVHFTLPFA